MSKKPGPTNQPPVKGSNSLPKDEFSTVVGDIYEQWESLLRNGRLGLDDILPEYEDINAMPNFIKNFSFEHVCDKVFSIGDELTKADIDAWFQMNPFSASALMSHMKGKPGGKSDIHNFISAFMHNIFADVEKEASSFTSKGSKWMAMYEGMTENKGKLDDLNFLIYHMKIITYYVYKLIMDMKYRVWNETTPYIDMETGKEETGNPESILDLKFGVLNRQILYKTIHTVENIGSHMIKPFIDAYGNNENSKKSMSAYMAFVSQHLKTDQVFELITSCHTKVMDKYLLPTNIGFSLSHQTKDERVTMSDTKKVFFIDKLYEGEKGIMELVKNYIGDEQKPFTKIASQNINESDYTLKGYVEGKSINESTFIWEYIFEPVEKMLQRIDKIGSTFIKDDQRITSHSFTPEEYHALWMPETLNLKFADEVFRNNLDKHGILGKKGAFHPPTGVPENDPQKKEWFRYPTLYELFRLVDNEKIFKIFSPETGALLPTNTKDEVVNNMLKEELKDLRKIVSPASTSRENVTNEDNALMNMLRDLSDKVGSSVKANESDCYGAISPTLIEALENLISEFQQQEAFLGKQNVT